MDSDTELESLAEDAGFHVTKRDHFFMLGEPKHFKIGRAQAIEICKARIALREAEDRLREAEKRRE